MNLLKVCIAAAFPWLALTATTLENRMREEVRVEFWKDGTRVVRVEVPPHEVRNVILPEGYLDGLYEARWGFSKTFEPTKWRAVGHYITHDVYVSNVSGCYVLEPLEEGQKIHYDYIQPSWLEKNKKRA